MSKGPVEFSNYPIQWEVYTLHLCHYCSVQFASMVVRGTNNWTSRSLWKILHYRITSNQRAEKGRRDNKHLLEFWHLPLVEINYLEVFQKFKLVDEEIVLDCSGISRDVGHTQV